MEQVYKLLLGSKYKQLDKYPSNVIKVIDLAVKAFDFVKRDEVENFDFVTLEMRKFITLAFKSPLKEILLMDLEQTIDSKSPKEYFDNVQKLIKDLTS